MCKMLFIGIKEKLEVIPFDQTRPDFYVEVLTENSNLWQTNLKIRISISLEQVGVVVATLVLKRT